MKMENKEHKEVEEQAKETQTQNATETEKELTAAETLEAASEEIAQLNIYDKLQSLTTIANVR